MGATGCEEVKWLAPVRPGDRLRVRMRVLDTRASRSRPDMGFVDARFDMLNADGVRVMTLDAPPDVRPPPDRAGRRAGRAMRFFEDMRVGERTELGSHTFTAEEIKAFARRYDPQRFHVDEEAAARSHFGALCASGWHTDRDVHALSSWRSSGKRPTSSARAARRRRETVRRPASATCAGSSRSMPATRSASRAR